MKKYLLLLCMLPLAVSAQNKIDSLKFEMIKTAVDFYTNDPIFDKVKSNTSICKNGDYICLLTFTSTNGLTGVDNKIKNWKDVKCSTIKQLSGLKDNILKDIFTGKEDRRKLKGYAEFMAAMGSYLPAVESAPAEPTTKISDSNVTKETPADTTGSDGSKDNSDSGGWKIWLALAAGLGGLGLGLRSLMTKPKKSSSAVKTGSGDADTGKLEARVAALNTQLPLKADISVLNAFEQKLNSLENRIIQLEKKGEDRPDSSNSKSTSDQKAPANSIKEGEPVYAKMPDLNNGFSNDILRNEQNGEQVYEIIITDQTATYSVSGNTAAQGYALNDVSYILGRACTLGNQPFPNCRIDNKLNGTLTKTAEGWTIGNKALVEFK